MFWLEMPCSQDGNTLQQTMNVLHILRKNDEVQWKGTAYWQQTLRADQMAVAQPG